MANPKLVSGRIAAMLLLALLLILAFSLWYRSGDPLTCSEQEHYAQALHELETELSADNIRLKLPATLIPPPLLVLLLILPLPLMTVPLLSGRRLTRARDIPAIEQV